MQFQKIWNTEQNIRHFEKPETVSEIFSSSYRRLNTLYTLLEQKVAGTKSREVAQCFEKNWY